MKTIALTAALIMYGILLLPYVNAQVEVKQSSTVNGQTTTTTTKSKSDWSSEQKISIQDGAKADLILKPGELKIHYCNEDNHCHNYTIWNNGTMTQEK
jgi:hypothetical protein